VTAGDATPGVAGYDGVDSSNLGRRRQIRRLEFDTLVLQGQSSGKLFASRACSAVGLAEERLVDLSNAPGRLLRRGRSCRRTRVTILLTIFWTPHSSHQFGFKYFFLMVVEPLANSWRCCGVVLIDDATETVEFALARRSSKRVLKVLWL